MNFLGEFLDKFRSLGSVITYVLCVVLLELSVLFVQAFYRPSLRVDRLG